MMTQHWQRSLKLCNPLTTPCDTYELWINQNGCWLAQNVMVQRPGRGWSVSPGASGHTKKAPPCQAGGQTCEVDQGFEGGVNCRQLGGQPISGKYVVDQPVEGGVFQMVSRWSSVTDGLEPIWQEAHHRVFCTHPGLRDCKGPHQHSSWENTVEKNLKACNRCTALIVLWIKALWECTL